MRLAWHPLFALKKNVIWLICQQFKVRSKKNFETQHETQSHRFRICKMPFYTKDEREVQPPLLYLVCHISKHARVIPSLEIRVSDNVIWLVKFPSSASCCWVADFPRKKCPLIFYGPIVSSLSFDYLHSKHLHLPWQYKWNYREYRIRAF